MQIQATIMPFHNPWDCYKQKDRQEQGLARVSRNWNPHRLLAAMYNGTTILRKIFYHGTQCNWHSNCTPCIYEVQCEILICIHNVIKSGNCHIYHFSHLSFLCVANIQTLVYKVL
jgi:hypothetical protein